MDLPKKSDDTNQVLEYYKKFSQNPDLSKYFSGPEAALVKKSTVSTGCQKESPEICTTNNPSIFTHVELDITSNIELPISCEMNQEEEENKNISPSSSIASNKKLEWDNGADIGYSNSYKLSTRKSASFPSLFTNELSVKSSKFINQSGEKPISENVKEMRNMYHQLTFSTETSSSPTVEHEIPSSSSTSTHPKELSASNTSQNEHIVKRFSSSSSGTSDKQIPYFQRRIGKPVANSTPYEELSSKSSEHENNKDTPVLRVQSKPKRNLNKNSEDSSEGERILGAGKNREKSNSSKSSDLVCQKSLLNPENPCSSIKNLGTSEGVQKLSKVQREINLCLTKPVFLECMSSVTKECLNKVSQTTFGLDKTSKAMQTDMFEFEKKIIHAPPPCVCTPLIQKVEFIHFKNGGICSPNETKPGFNHSRQQSLEVSNASSLKNEEKEMNNSFEDMKMNTKMVRGNSDKKPETSTESEVSEKNHTNVVDLKNRDLQRNKYFEKNKKIENIKNEKSVKEVGNSLYSKDENNSESISASNSESCHLKNINGESKFDTIHDSCSDEMILAEMISLNHSRDLNTDIKRSIDILQKLLKSKKYDQSTKKYYIKKIVQKIVESKYSDDSTTSSEFFRPKKTQSGRENTQGKEAMETYMPKNKLRYAQSEVKLMDNVPWFPVLQTKNASPRKKNKKLDGKNAKYGMGTNIRNAENRSKPVAKDDHDLVKGKNFKNTPDFNLLEKQQMKNFENDVKMTSSSPHDIQFSDGLIHTKPQGAKYRPTSCDYKINDKNWKGVKTLSERLIENRDKVVSKIGQGDYLLHVATTERQHQLSWINNEIEHLVKLKDLLEKKKKKPEPQMNKVISSLLKMKVDDMKVDISPPMQEGQSSSKKSGSLSSSLREIPSNDEAPSLSANSHHVQSPKGDTRASVTRNQRNMQLYMFTTQNPMIASESSRSDTCKCNQTATHEEKDIQCPASKQCTCQTEPKEDVKIQCSCKADAGVTCKCGETACQCQNENVCECKKSESSSSSGSSSSSDTLISCVCCKKEKVLKNLMNKLPLCDPCQQVHQKCFYPYKYSNPLHSCMCYSLLDQDTLCQLKSTLTELERLDIYQQYCEVLKNCKCCKTCGCKCKLPKKFKNGCAYFLKLEDACPNKHCEEEEQGEFDYEQCCEGEEEEEEEEEKYLPQVTVKVPNCKGACSRKKKNENKDGTKKQMSCPSIQTYLCAMRPEFVERAERRRRILRLATLQREEDLEKRKLKYVDKVNYLNHLNQPVSSEANMCGTYGHQAKTYCFVDVALDDSPKRVRPRVFRSFREMKDLTRRKYLHLSEVRSKKDIHKEKRLREANRILANTFTRRLQKSTLRGNVDIPHNVRVVSY